jgi:TolB-like protein/DNA-binding winged helix-turn-helix (wHTH) protein/tetratricopeptide (TPR) repeat protein
MDVLVLLAERAGRVVPREELIEVVWQKQYVAESALSGAICEIREVFGDNAQDPRFIETIPKRGYRLVAPVRFLRPEREEAPAPRARSPSGRRRLALVVVAVAAVAALIVMLLGRRQGGMGRAGPEPTIVVLPFENLGAPQYDYFASGIAEEITGRLAGLQGLQVISALSAGEAARSGATADVIGKLLGAEYVLQGTVRWDNVSAGAPRVRITPRLVRVADGAHVWADVYDRVLDDIFSVQAEIALEVCHRLDATLLDREVLALERRPTGDLTAYEAYLRGMSYLHGFHVEGYRSAAYMFERAVTLDPSFASAWARLSLTKACIVFHGGGPHDELLDEAKQAADRALALDPTSPDAHRALAYYIFWGLRDYDRALVEFEAAAQRRPNDGQLLADMGYVKRRQGRWQEAESLLRRALELNPRSAMIAYNLAYSATAFRHYTEADTLLDRAITSSPDSLWFYLQKIRNYWHWDGTPERARAVFQTLPEPNRPDAVAHLFLQRYYERDFEGALQALFSATFRTLSVEDLTFNHSLMECSCYHAMKLPEQTRERCGVALAELKEEVAARPRDARLHSALGWAHALLGNRDAAIREGQRAVELAPLTADAIEGPISLLALARIWAIVGAHDEALSLLERLLTMPSFVDPGILRLDPDWDPLRGDPRFAALLDRPPQLSTNFTGSASLASR